MIASHPNTTPVLLYEVRHAILDRHLPRIARCMRLLSEQDVWWRPNRASNSAGNLVLHLAGNVRQWIVSGLGGAPDIRERDREFAERGSVTRRKLLAALNEAVKEAAKVISNLSPQDLETEYIIQGFRVSGFQAVFHLAEHFAFHSGQIQYITKLKTGRDLAFTRLPGARRPSGRHSVKPKSEVKGRTLPQI